MKKKSVFCGYVVRLSESDEFLAFIEDTLEKTVCGFVKVPDYAKIYWDRLEALCEAAQCKGKAVVSLLFEDEEKFIVVSCEG